MTVPTEQGEQPLVIGGVFETGRPAGIKKGTPLDATLAVTISPLPLKPDSRYVWKLTINGQSNEDWQVAFTTRPANANPGAQQQRME